MIAHAFCLSHLLQLDACISQLLVFPAWATMDIIQILSISILLLLIVVKAFLNFSSFVTAESFSRFMALALGHVLLVSRNGVSRSYNTYVIPPSNIYFSQAFAFFRDVPLARLSYVTSSGQKRISSLSHKFLA